MKFVLFAALITCSTLARAGSIPGPLMPLATCAGVSNVSDVVIARVSADGKSIAILIGPGPAIRQSVTSVDPSTSSSGTTYRTDDYALKVKGKVSTLVQRIAEDQSEPIPLICQRGHR